MLAIVQGGYTISERHTAATASDGAQELDPYANTASYSPVHGLQSVAAQ